MLKKNLVFISTHTITKAVICEYNKLKNIDGYDCILCIDNTNLNLDFESRICEKVFFDNKIKCFIFDEGVHKELNLPNIARKKLENPFQEIMWYNGDYRFYYVKKYFPGYKFYWQIEYDVFFNGNSYKHFFKKYENKKEDLLVTKFRAENNNSDWYWTKNIGWIYDEKIQKYGSFFPVCRLSDAAIDLLYKKRIEQGEIYKNKTDFNNKKWLHCEIFVPTELMNNNFSCASIIEPNVTLNEIDLNEERIFEIPDNKLYHPVKGNLLQRLKDEKQKNKVHLEDHNKNKHVQINFFGFKIKFKSNWFINIVK